MPQQVLRYALVGLLEGSPFPDYRLPGLALGVMVGGTAVAAAILLARGHPWASLVSLASGIVIIGFELMEVWAVGSPVGVARNLQGFYLVLGFLIVALSLAQWLGDRSRWRDGRPSAA